MASIEMSKVCPFVILIKQMYLATSNANYLVESGEPGAVQHLPFLSWTRVLKGRDVVLHRDAGCCRDGGVDVKRLAHDGVKVLQRIGLIHRNLVPFRGFIGLLDI